MDNVDIQNPTKKNTRTRSTKPKFNLKLNEEQKQAKANIFQNDVIALFGKAGSGKTMLATQVALEALLTKEISTIYITRPTVSDEDIGFLPGDIKDKLDPWLVPIYHNMYQCYGKPNITKMIDNNEINILPLSFMRGITLLDSFVIVDECQNITKKQMKMIITRLGKGSKILFCGDTAQIDLKRQGDSGLQYLIDVGKDIDGFYTCELQTNHRHPIVDKFIEKFEN